MSTHIYRDITHLGKNRHMCVDITKVYWPYFSIEVYLQQADTGKISNVVDEYISLTALLASFIISIC